jgi:hypothetical protein
MDKDVEADRHTEKQVCCRDVSVVFSQERVHPGDLQSVVHQDSLERVNK